MVWRKFKNNQQFWYRISMGIGIVLVLYLVWMVAFILGNEFQAKIFGYLTLGFLSGGAGMCLMAAILKGWNELFPVGALMITVSFLMLFLF